MNTPICDFVRAYADKEPLRLHMPGHKGRTLLGPEALDITEIPGADVLYRAEGIIRESEENAASLFGSAKIFYSTEGSSLCIRAMLALALMYAKLSGRKPCIAAGRNAHKVFLEASALLDLEIKWIFGGSDLLSCDPTAEELEKLFSNAEHAPCAVYLTSPDYLGHCVDIGPLAAVCHRHGALLLVDNAHGAYLRFLSPSRHPLDLGADLCCDSAHKTLPVLTGGAYLHLSRSCPETLQHMGQQALSLFASTSPSYLILQSLDACNRVLAEDYPARLKETAERLEHIKQTLSAYGWTLCGEEPMKLCICPKSRGYTGDELAERLRRMGIQGEFADPDHLVLMFSPDTDPNAFQRLSEALQALPRREALLSLPPTTSSSQAVLSPREALLSPFETLPTKCCLGRILAAPSVGCPPAVPILICGERIDENAIRQFDYYGISELDVVLES